tara:strand:+ start:227 stop:439 length:213 start_codon:yes stop_codon:yes gene_type:complete
MYQIKIENTASLSESKSEVTVKITHDFKMWFKVEAGLKRWNNKKFQKVFLESMANYRFVDDIDTVNIVVE